MLGIDLLILAVLVAALGMHPFVTYPLSLAALARLHPRRVAVSGTAPPGSAALCVCAYNEEAIIRAKAENMLAMRATFPELELLIYVDAATDRTAQILAEYQDRIRVIVSPLRKGKTHGMNTLVRACSADYIVFSDANVFFAPDAVPRLLAPFADSDIGCVCGHLVYTMPDASGTASTGSIYWRLEEAIKNLESRTGSVMGADGSIFAIRRVLHRPPPPDIIDDMYVSLCILCSGRRIVRAGEAMAYEASVSRPGEEFRRKIRIACQAFNVHRLLRPQLRRLGWLDRYKYASHKLLRWWAAYLFIAAGALLLAALGIMGAWLEAAGLVLAGALLTTIGLLQPNGPIGKLLDVAGAFAATGLGILNSLRGERFQTWNPPSSARTR